MAEVNAKGRNRSVLGIWLLTVAFLVFCMVVLGGVTRLTESGLSMVDWRPVTGWLPPLDDAAWQAEFDKYKQFPEYQKVNRGMSLDDFRMIFAFEYAHRLLGRIIGLAFILPLLFFWWRGLVGRRDIVPLLGLFLLGGLQGGIGWFMVASGLVDRPDVSQYRLALHLFAALLIFSLLLWRGWMYLGPPPQLQGQVKKPRAHAWILLAAVAVQIVLGAFVAGTNAGFSYNTFPLMEGAFIPDGIGELQPWWLNLFENTLTVQFDHRMWAYMVVVLTVALVMQTARYLPDAVAMRAAWWVMAAVVAQFVLGVATLLAVVPVPLGALHQAGAVIVLALVLRFLYLLRGRAA